MGMLYDGYQDLGRETKASQGKFLARLLLFIDSAKRVCGRLNKKEATSPLVASGSSIYRYGL
jgi:hypothetical protein